MSVAMLNMRPMQSISDILKWASDKPEPLKSHMFELPIGNTRCIRSVLNNFLVRILRLSQISQKHCLRGNSGVARSKFVSSSEEVPSPHYMYLKKT